MMFKTKAANNDTYSVLYHWTSKAGLENIKKDKKIKAQKPKGSAATPQDVKGVYLTQISLPEEVKNVLGSDIQTDIRINIPTHLLNWDNMARPQLYNGDFMRGKVDAINALRSVYETAYLEDLHLANEITYTYFLLGKEGDDTPILGAKTFRSAVDAKYMFRPCTMIRTKLLSI